MKHHFQHKDPICGSDFNRLIQVRLLDEDEQEVGEEFEQLECVKLNDGRLKIACVPLYVYDLALDDVVEPLDFGEVRVVERSGRYVFRIMFRDLGSIEWVLSSLDELGCRWERQRVDFYAIDCPDIEVAEQASGLLFEHQARGELEYETGKLHDDPCPFTLGLKLEWSRLLAAGVQLRKVQIGDQFEFDCSCGYGNSGIENAYAVVLGDVDGNGGSPLVATFSNPVTEGEIAAPGFIDTCLYLGGCERAPMASGKWRWINRLPIPVGLPIPDDFWVWGDPESPNPTIAIESGTTGYWRYPTDLNELKGVRPREPYNSESTVALATLCRFHNLSIFPSAEQYGDVDWWDLQRFDARVESEAIEALRRILENR